MKQIVNAFVILAATVVLVVMPAATVVHAQCTNASLTGNYGITSSGFAAQGKGLSGNEAPWALVGVIAFDGAGNFSSTWTYASNGVINRGFTGSGTYTVNPDCTGSSVFTSGPAGFSFDVVIVSGGAEVFLIATSPGNTITFDLKKQ